MHRLLALSLLCLIVALPLHAQDDESALYDTAIQRIEKAREDNETELDLAWGLTELPPEIGQLTQLQVLYLEHNPFTSLPPEIGLLNNLQVLLFYNNQLTTLPPEIGHLSNLQVLGLRKNQLINLPSEIGQLNNLQILGLEDNQLTSLPAEIRFLSNLQVLDLGDNQLASLPSEIGLLANLCYLNLANNNIHYLPPSLSNLSALGQQELCQGRTSGIYLDGNPLVSPPPEVVEQGTAAILDYLRNQAWYHTQRLILGAAGGVGLMVLLLLGFRWKQYSGRKSKSKRGN